MAGAAESSTPDAGADGRPSSGAGTLDRIRSIGVVRGVVAITFLAIAARFVFLGARTFHWDEARVGYWILHTMETGDFAYRRIIHGPLIQHVNRGLFSVFGPSDFLARAPVALVGGLLPLSALLYREHLEDDEVVVLALFLAFSAVLVYYSRFMRSDILVAAFMFAALGMLIRVYDTRRARYLYGAAVLIALGFASKENALVYVLTWLGATGLLADQALYRPRNHESGLALLRSTWLGAAGRRRLDVLDRAGDDLALLEPRRLRRRVGEDGAGTVARNGLAACRAWLDRGWIVVRRTASKVADSSTRVGATVDWLLHGIAAVGAFLLVTVFLYGPRGAGEAGLRYPPVAESEPRTGFFSALADPLSFPAYAEGALSHAYAEFGAWIGQSSEPGCHKESVIDGWLCYLAQYVEVMLSVGFVLTVFAVLGFLYERYGRSTSRNLVMFSAYAGFVSVLGYPLGTDVFGAWIVVHALVPLAIPAAVGVATIYRWGVEASAERDAFGTTIAVVVLVLLASQVAVANVGSVYTNDTAEDNLLVQYAQPGHDLDPVTDAMREAAVEEREGADVVLYYGELGADRDGNIALVDRSDGWSEGELMAQPACANWFNSLPLPWYLGTTDANVTCDRDPRNLVDQAESEAPGVIVTMEGDGTVPVERLHEAGYESATFDLRSGTPRKTARVFVHDRLDVGFD